MSWKLAFLVGSVLLLPSVAEGGDQLGVVINEINYAPSGAAADPKLRFEYVELYNSTATAIDVTGWTLRDLDAANADETLFTLSVLALPAYSFLTIHAAAATGTLAEDSDLDDGSGLLIAAGWTGSAGLNNAGDAPQLYDTAGTTIQDFVYYDEVNSGDASVDDDAVAEGIWNDGAAIDTLSSGTTGRAIALMVDGEAPNEAVPGAEDSDWLQYSTVAGGTPGRWNDPTVIFLDRFESGDLGRWSSTVL